MSEPLLDGWDKHSIWAEDRNITPFRTNAKRWHKDWEKLLPILCAAWDVFLTMHPFFSRGSLTEEETSTRLAKMSSELAASQQSLAYVWPRLIDDGQFVKAWYRFDEKRLKCHISNGIEEICQLPPFGQDSRSLCPEISLLFMLEEKGRVFIDFLNTFTLGKETAGEGKPYFVPSAWWDDRDGFQI